ncbi:MAG: class I SAM-dependent methyltransferase [Patescibacteria group bacterium]|jgi:tRNA (cmo5U34)-methyltransferase
MKAQKPLVQATDLNYHYYSQSKYDRNIISAIPFHKEIHTALLKELKKRFCSDEPLRILELGVGTGLTSALVRSAFPSARFEVVDFSSTMLDHAKKRLGQKNVSYVLGDFGKLHFHGQYDVILSVIGIHHQSHAGKQRLFKKIAGLLKPRGVFLFGDLMTSTDPHETAERDARHFHHLVEHSDSRSTLRDWAYHHMFLNNLAPIENQEQWLIDTGCKVKRLFYKWNTALLLVTK